MVSVGGSATSSGDGAGPAREGHLTGPITVLLVEDDDGDALLVAELLADAEVETDLHLDLHRVRYLDEALAVLTHVEVDCLLLDLGLPDAVDLDAVERVVAQTESLHRMPAVVVLTGRTGHHDGVRAVAAGADDYLVKSDTDGATLARSLRYAILRRRSAAQQIALYRSEVRAAETTRLERALLPKELVRDDRISVRVGYLPGGNGLLGGDFFDTVEREDGTLFLVIGDVAGHGPDEAALGAAMRTAWRTLVLSGTDPDDLLPLMERVLLPERGRPEVFVTLCQVVVTPDRSAMDVYLAGHPSPLLITGRDGALRFEEVSPAHRGRALGIPAPGTWRARHIDLAVPWTAVLYTDGLVEAAVADDASRPRRLGAHGLRAVVEEELARGTGEIVTRILRRVRDLHGGPLVDDAALLFVGWGGTGTTVPGERTSTLADSAEWTQA